MWYFKLRCVCVCVCVCCHPICYGRRPTVHLRFELGARTSRGSRHTAGGRITTQTDFFFCFIIFFSAPCFLPSFCGTVTPKEISFTYNGMLLRSKIHDSRFQRPWEGFRGEEPILSTRASLADSTRGRERVLHGTSGKPQNTHGAADPTSLLRAAAI